MNKVRVTLEGSAKAEKGSAKTGWMVILAAGKSYGPEVAKNPQTYLWEVVQLTPSNKDDLIAQFNEETGEEGFGEDYIGESLRLAGNHAFVIAPNTEPKKVAVRSLGKDIEVKPFVAFNNKEYVKYEAPVYKIGGKFYVTDHIYTILAGM